MKWLVLAILLFPSIGWAQDEETPSSPETAAEEQIELAEPRAEARLISPSPWIGQMAEVEVRLLRDNRGENGAPFFGETYARGGMVQLARYTPIPSVVTENGTEYLEQRRVYQIFPQYGDMLVFPQLQISWFEGEEQQSVLTNSVDIPLRVQDGIPEDRVWVAAPEVTVTQDIIGDPDTFKVGDAITRIIKVEAKGTDAVMLPPLEFTEIDGMKQYIGEPRLKSTVARGVYTASREDRVTYVAQRWGFFDLPAQRITWFDTRSGTFAEAVAEPISFRARLNPEMGSSCVGTADSVPRGATSFIVLLLVVFGIREMLKRRKPQGSSDVGIEPDLEPARFSELIAAIKTADPTATVNAAYRWFRYRTPDPVTLDHLAEDDDGFAANASELSAMVVHQDSRWDASQFAQQVTSHRSQRPLDDADELKKLNP